MSVTTSWPPSLSRPCNTVSSMRNASATISPLNCFTSSIVPATVPPVARRSSTMRTREPGLRASLCISRVADPYSRSYSTLTTSEGSLPSLRTGTKPTPSLYAIGAAKMNPRDSIPTTASIFLLPIFARSPSMAALNPSPSLSRVVMSLKRIPGFGKSGTSRIRLPRSVVCTGTAHRLASRPSEARPAHALLPARVFRAHRAKRGRFLVRDEPHRPADHPVQGRAVLWRDRADDGRREAPRGHGPGWHRHRGPLALDAALVELRRAMDELRMQGVVVLSNIRGRALADPVYRPFFEEADRRKVCVFVHPMIPAAADAFTEYVLGPIVGFPFDTTVAIAKLCYAGVFKQLPNIRWLVAHAGGAIPYLLERLDSGWRDFAECRVNIDQPPSFYLKQLYYDTVTFSPHNLRLLRDVIGADHMVMGSDYPHLLGSIEKAVTSIEGVDFSQAEKERIFSGTAMSVMNNVTEVPLDPRLNPANSGPEMARPRPTP